MKMRCFALVALLLTMGLSSSAWAASSRENRAEQTVYLEATDGVHPATYLSGPVFGAGFYLGPDWQIGLEYGSNTYSAKIANDQGKTDSKIDATYVNYGAQVRWFPGTNSFNMGFALNQRNWDVKFKSAVTPTGGGADIPVSSELKANATVPAFILGNQWMMDFGMVIAIDWIVLSAPAASSTSYTIDAQTKAALNASSPSDLAKAQQQGSDAGKLLNQISGFPGILLFSIGWAF
jgi:hypothetical protein